MKTLLTTLLFTLLFAFNLSAQNKSADDLIVEGIYQEEVLGNLEKAADLFNQVLKDFSNDRKECAQATYHLGLIAEKGENGKGAKGYYNRILEEYREVGVYADLSRNRLEKINNKNTFVDPRDGHKYKWVKIGDQVWMAENLAFMPWVNPPKKQEYGIWVYDYDGHDVSEAKATENYQKYGCLYDWPTAMALEPKYLEKEWKGDPENNQGLCPPGWRIPSDKDWTELELLLGMTQKMLKERADPWNMGYWDSHGANKLKTTQGWLSGGNGIDSLRLSILPGGSRTEEFDDFIPIGTKSLGASAFFWTSNNYNDSIWNDNGVPNFNMAQSRHFWNLYQGTTDDRIARGPYSKTSGFSIRCVKSHNPILNSSKVSLQYQTERKGISKLEPPFKPEYIESNLELVTVIKKSNSHRGGIAQIDKNFFVWNPDDTTMALYDQNNHKLIWSLNDLILRSGSDGHENVFFNQDTIVYYNGSEIISLLASTGKRLKSIPMKGVKLLPIVHDSLLIIARGKWKEEIQGIKASSGELVWSYNLGDSLASYRPVSDGRTMYFGCRSRMRNLRGDGNAGPNLFAIDLSSGELVWSYSSKYRGSHRSPLLLGDQLIYMNHYEQYVYSFNKMNGSVNWRYYMENGASTNFTLMDNLIYFTDRPFRNSKSILYCIDHKGNTVFKKILNDPPAFYKVNNNPENNYALIITGKIKSEAYLNIMSLSKDGDNWMFPMPNDFIGEADYLGKHFYVRTKDEIYIYKYPNLDE